MPHKIILALIAVQCVLMLSACRDGSSGSVRKAILANSWYPGGKDELAAAVDGYLDQADTPDLEGKVVGLVSPHAGYYYSGRAAAHGYKAIQKGDYDVVVVMAPSHRARFPGASILNVDCYSTPLGEVKLDRSACDRLVAHELVSVVPQAHSHEHSLEIQLPFLQRRLGDFLLVPIVVGSLAPAQMQQLAAAIKEVTAGRRVLYVASSDFTHYGPRFGYVPFRDDVKDRLKKLDMGAVDYILSKDMEGFVDYKGRTGITCCGWQPIATLIALAEEGWQAKLLNYYTSGDLEGDWRNSVSYVSLAFVSAQADAGGAPPKGDDAAALSDDEQATLLTLARATLESYVRDGTKPRVDQAQYTLTPALRATCGVFVTLKKHGRLRGCIGHIMGRLPLHEGVVENTINSAAKDTRFPPVRPDELGDIDIEVSVLTPFRAVSSAQDFVPGKHGIYIQKGFSSAVFLPQVATEQGWDRADTFRHLCRKAGLPNNAWEQPGMKFHICEGFKFGEKER